MQKTIPKPSKSVGQNTRGCFRALETALTRALSSVGIRYSHFQVLHVLWHGDGLTQGQLAEATYITDSSLAQVVNEMVTQKLVERRHDSKDGRKRLIFLTTKGADVQGLVKSPVLSVMNVALRGLTNEEIDSYISICMRIHNNVRSEFDLRQSNQQPKKAS